MRAMILAAGRGERMRPLTQETPKPLLEVRGRALIEYHLQALRAAGIRDIVVNLSWLGERIRSALDDGARWGVSIRYTEEGPEPLETGGGIFNALSLLGPGPFIVVNGDVWTDFPFSRLTLANGSHSPSRAGHQPGASRAGDFSLENGRVMHASGTTYTFSGIAMYRPAFFAGCTAGRFPLLPLLRRAIDASTLSGELYEGVWSDVGTPERLAELQSGKIA